MSEEDAPTSLSALIWCAAALQVVERKYQIGQMIIKIGSESRTIKDMLDAADNEIAEGKKSK